MKTISDEEAKELEDMVVKAREWSCEDTVKALTLGEFATLINPMQFTKWYLEEMRRITEKVKLFIYLAHRN